MLKEFKEFAVKGNVVDLAIGIILGVAFTAIVNSLVNDIIMPPIGVLLGGTDFTDLYINLSGGEYASLEAAREAGAATINYGIFINAVITFVIVAWVLFFLVKGMNRLKRQEEEKPAEPAAPPREEVLLEEIRDLLKQQQS
ncbi:MAG: large conductance mechanosensitive channel protein MscL [Pseudomonadota bacterium]